MACAALRPAADRATVAGPGHRRPGWRSPPSLGAAAAHWRGAAHRWRGVERHWPDDAYRCSLRRATARPEASPAGPDAPARHRRCCPLAAAARVRVRHPRRPAPGVRRVRPLPPGNARPAAARRRRRGQSRAPVGPSFPGARTRPVGHSRRSRRWAPGRRPLRGCPAAVPPGAPGAATAATAAEQPRESAPPRTGQRPRTTERTGRNQGPHRREPDRRPLREYPAAVPPGAPGAATAATTAEQRQESAPPRAAERNRRHSPVARTAEEGGWHRSRATDRPTPPHPPTPGRPPRARPRERVPAPPEAGRCMRNRRALCVPPRFSSRRVEDV
ncbi:hypothetical protein FHX37_4014 [Haloactinospora alba]|uniref:Uncharacterized protein n=1 Tax=Haloactinospora alba TaxID=405555 RepID=A0A543NA02_9ACTN|nr:hypothetical protein FHX37_4014 [Haloactinospora alba]